MSQKPTCQVVRPEGTYKSKQGFGYLKGISAEMVGAKGICMHLLTLPPGAKAKAHLHENHETAIYVLKGEAEMWYGDNLSEHLVVREGEYLYIPSGMPHLPANLSDSEFTAVISRTDPNEQVSKVLLPELDDAVDFEL